jgi:hypothetical protein
VSLPVADPESFVWVGTQYRNSAPQYATVLATVLRYLGHRKSGVVLSLPKTRLGPPLVSAGAAKDADTASGVHCGRGMGCRAPGDLFRLSRLLPHTLPEASPTIPPIDGAGFVRGSHLCLRVVELA